MRVIFLSHLPYASEPQCKSNKTYTQQKTIWMQSFGPLFWKKKRVLDKTEFTLKKYKTSQTETWVIRIIKFIKYYKDHLVQLSAHHHHSAGPAIQPAKHVPIETMGCQLLQQKQETVIDFIKSQVDYIHSLCVADV